MINIFIISHIIISILLILFILINKGKGSEIGISSNNPNTNILDIHESTNILRKIIIIIALISILLNVSINITSKNIKNKNEQPLIQLIKDK